MPWWNGRIRPASRNRVITAGVIRRVARHLVYKPIEQSCRDVRASDFLALISGVYAVVGTLDAIVSASDEETKGNTASTQGHLQRLALPNGDLGCRKDKFGVVGMGQLLRDRSCKQVFLVYLKLG